MDLKLGKSQIINESVARRVFFRIFLFFSAISIIPIVHILTTYDFTNYHLPKSRGCYSGAGNSTGNSPELPRGSYLFQGHFLNPVWDSFETVHCQENVNLTIIVIKELVDRNHLFNQSAKLLYVGGSSSSAVSAMRDFGFYDAVGVDHGSVKLKQFGYKLDYVDCYFDFVLFRGNFKVVVPDHMVVVEVERVVKKGGIGAVVLGSLGSGYSVRLVDRVSRLLKNSCIVYSGYVNNFYMIVFKKKNGDGGYGYGYSDQFHRFPVNCSTFIGNRSFFQKMKHL